MAGDTHTVAKAAMRVITGLEREIRNLTRDKRRIDWLNEQVVDTIYLDDGTIIDVRGGSVRTALDEARSRKSK